MKLVEEERHRGEMDSGMLTLRNFEALFSMVFNSTVLCFRRLDMIQVHLGGRLMSRAQSLSRILPQAAQQT